MLTTQDTVVHAQHPKRSPHRPLSTAVQHLAINSFIQSLIYTFTQRPGPIVLQQSNIKDITTKSLVKCRQGAHLTDYA